MTFLRSLFILVVTLCLGGCATYKPQYKNNSKVDKFPDKEIAYSFYLIGNGGDSPKYVSSEAIRAFKLDLNKASKNSTALFLGDNIYPNGLPEIGERGRGRAEYQLNTQIDAVANFKGDALFIPGNHDWYSDGLEGLKRQQMYVEDQLGENTFLPKNGCPIVSLNITESIVMIIVDSEWYLTNWDKHPTINDGCSIKTRAAFFDEFESEIQKARGKTTIIALHHPIFTNGSHGGQYSFWNHMTPVPGVGTLKNVIRRTGGVLTEDNQNKRYLEFRKRIVTLSQENDKIIFVSGHDNDLQYIVEDNLPQIISGSGSKSKATRNVGGGHFSYGALGYARLDVFTDGSSFVRFYSENEVVFQTQVLAKDVKNIFEENPNSYPEYTTASVYTEEETNQTVFYKWLWGERYREDYSTKILAPTADLDTLFGGLTPVREDRGYQSKSLWLKDKGGREYVMRALRKNAVQYMQAVAFKDQYIEGQFEDTYTEGLLLDVFTGSHPYAPFVIGQLADSVGVLHTSPSLYYVPKQKALGDFAADFGDELYMVEVRRDSGEGGEASFGFSKELISTDALLNNLMKSSDYKLDESAYIRTRLFDMLIGDWDRHDDEWSWAAFKTGTKTLYRPVSRDHDQAFSVMSDGVVLEAVTKLVPSVSGMKRYSDNLKKPKNFNAAPYPLDMALINQSGKSVWDAQVAYLKSHLTDEAIDAAFFNFPPEINQKSIEEIKQKLIGRRENLQEISNNYFNHINKYGIIKGTNEGNLFNVERLLNNKTKVTVFRVENGEKGEMIHDRTYNKNQTKEIWIYGLGGDDIFEVYGDGKDNIRIRLIGGQGNDVYDVWNGKKLYLYDQETKVSRFSTFKGSKKLTDEYEINVYNYKKLKNNVNKFMPIVGFNPDDGFKLGFANTWTNYGYERNPYSSKHTVSGVYFFATNGFDLRYNGEVANVIGDLNLGYEGLFTSPNYTINFFGYGNATPDYKDEGANYNRVRLKTIAVLPSLIWRGELDASLKFGIALESIEVEETEGRFINDEFVDNSSPTNNFYGVFAKYQFKNVDNEAFPTLGMLFNVKMGYTNNLGNSNSFAYVIPELGFAYKLVNDGKLVLATKFSGQLNIGNGFEFYQAATIGANKGLRGFRNDRFTGKSAFVQSNDLRLNLQKLKTDLLPVYLGVFGGFDYGRVWVNSDLYLNPSYQSNNWHTSFGAGVFANAVNLLTLNAALFHSVDGFRFSFGLGFDF